MARSYPHRPARHARPWFCFYALLAAAVLFSGGRTGAQVASGQGDQQGTPTSAAKMYRPITLDDHGETLTIEDLRLTEIVNQRGVEIFTTSPDLRGDDGAAAAFGTVVIRNCEIANLRRAGASVAADHVEAIRITGGGSEQQPFTTDVLIEDVYIHDGQGAPILIQDGRFGKITLRRVRIEQMSPPAVQIAFVNHGSAERIEIEDSPGVVVRLIGKPGSVGEVATTGSPDAKIQDELSDKPAALAAAERVEPVKLAVPPSTAKAAAVPAAAPTPAPAQAPTPAPAPAPAQTAPVEPAKPIEITATATDDGSVRITAANVPAEISHLTFALFNRFGYRIGTPVILTEAPWEATIKVGRPGTYTARLIVTRSGGSSDRPIDKTVELR